MIVPLIENILKFFEQMNILHLFTVVVFIGTLAGIRYGYGIIRSKGYSDYHIICGLLCTSFVFQRDLESKCITSISIGNIFLIKWLYDAFKGTDSNKFWALLLGYILYVAFLASFVLKFFNVFFVGVYLLRQLYLFYRRNEFVNALNQHTTRSINWTLYAIGALISLFILRNSRVFLGSTMLAGLNFVLLPLAAIILSNWKWIRYGLPFRNEGKFIRFIDLETLKDCMEFPRSPEYDGLTCTLDTINRNESLLIFVSHSWLRGSESPAHPDNTANSQLQLCKDGIDWIRKYMAPGMKKCYVWVDYCCIDQTNRKSLSASLKRYDKIIECCDVLFTPIVSCHGDRRMVQGDADPFSSCSGTVQLWNSDHPQSYLSRAWCRVEMLYAAKIPVLPNTNGVERYSQLRGALSMGCRWNRRPHLLYSTKMHMSGSGPIVLPPLQSRFYEQYHPLKGSVTVATDMDCIAHLIETLVPYIETHRSCYRYRGSRKYHFFGPRHGHGVEQCENGDVYEGEWKDDKRCGKGTLWRCDGEEPLKYSG